MTSKKRNRAGIIMAVALFSTSFISKAQQKNILLIISDDLNTRIGPYMDLDKHTPNLERLTQEGVRFTRAYCQYPLCGPSRASLMSGLYPETNKVLGNKIQLGSYRAENPALINHPSMAGFFRENGYYTARSSKIFHMGVPGGIEQGHAGSDDPDSWDYFYNVLGPETLSDGELECLSPANKHYGSSFVRMILKDELASTQTDYLATSQAIAMLENRAGDIAPDAKNKVRLKPDAPFFIGVGLVRPHVPLIAPENCFRHYPVDEVALPPVEINDDVPKEALRKQNEKIWKMNALQQQKTISAYMASVRFMDQQVGRLLDALDRLGIRDETIVIFISDHGYNLGEHDCWGKGGLWEGEARIPMIISHPGYKNNHGNTCENIVELIDLYPTLIELCGLSDKQPDILQGESLVDFIKGTTTAIDNEAYTVTYGGKGASIRTNRWRYTRWGKEIETDNEELYDHNNDPEEHNNIAYDPQYKDILKKMRKNFEIKKKETCVTEKPE